ncbi:MAG: TRAP transporter small permease subunit [Flammeovirgaceae bacterium]
MHRFLKQYIHMVNQLNDGIGKLAGWLTTGMVFLICFDVIAKFIAPKLDIHYSNTAVFEMQWHIFALVFLLGIAYTLRHDRHVRVDLFYSKFSPKGKAWVNLIGVLLFLLPFCFIVIETSLTYVKNSYLMNEKSPDPGGLPYRFVLKGMIIVGFALLALQGIALLFKSLLTITEKGDEQEAVEVSKH